MCSNALWIAILPTGISAFVFSLGLYKLLRQCKLKNRSLCVYGAGRHAKECLDYLRIFNIIPKAFLVTEKEGNPDDIQGIPVEKASDFTKKYAVSIIIAILPSGLNEVVSYLKLLISSGRDIEYIHLC